MDNNMGGLGLTQQDTMTTIYVEIKPDAYLVRRLSDNESVKVFRQEEAGELEDGYRIRTLQMGPNEGQKVAEQTFNSLTKVQLKKAYSEEKFGQHRMILVFNNMQDNSPNIHVQGTLISNFNSVNGFASNFIDKIPNIKIGSLMDFSTWKMTDKNTGKDRRGVTIVQNGDKVKSAYFDYVEMKSIGDKPRAKKVTKLGKETWDFTPVAEFQLDQFHEFSAALDNYWNNGNNTVVEKAKEEVVDMPF
jgi:hypothetical protein